MPDLRADLAKRLQYRHVIREAERVLVVDDWADDLREQLHAVAGAALAAELRPA
jgi:hypothetical protein